MPSLFTQRVSETRRVSVPFPFHHHLRVATNRSLTIIIFLQRVFSFYRSKRTFVPVVYSFKPRLPSKTVFGHDPVLLL